MNDLLAKIRRLVTRHNVGYRQCILDSLDKVERGIQRRRDNILSALDEAEFNLCGHDDPHVSTDEISNWLEVIRAVVKGEG
jgi:hypothetical protein